MKEESAIVNVDFRKAYDHFFFLEFMDDFFYGKDGFATMVIGSVSSFPFIFHLYWLCSNSPIDGRRVQVSHLQMKPFFVFK